MNKQNFWLDRFAWYILGSCTMFYAIIFSVAAIYKFQSFWMGFDLGVHEQVLWNTMHGRIAEISAKEAVRSYLGVDIILLELLITPLYALVPRTETLLVIQIVLASSGTIPLFLLAREYSGLTEYGFLAAFLYLAALPIQYAILYEFQIRVVGTVLFLWAFYFLEMKRFIPFLLMGILAVWSRSEAGFTLAAMGWYALIHRYKWYWVFLPMGIGIGWVVLCMKTLIPFFRDDHGFLYGFIFSWLGNTPKEMIRTLLLHPGVVAEHLLTQEKFLYLFELFAPLLFLPLLRPDILVMALPSLAINLLSAEHIHWSIRYHYQAFVVPFLLVATVYAIIDRRLEQGIGDWDLNLSVQESRLRRQRRSQFTRPSSSDPRLMVSYLWFALLNYLRLRWLVILLIIVTLGSQVALRSPLIQLATRPRDTTRIAFAYNLMQHLPDDAPITVTSGFGSHLGRRQEIYFFPGNIIYPPSFVERGHYLLADLHEVDNHIEKVRQLQQSNRWRTLVEEQDFVFMKRVSP